MFAWILDGVTDLGITTILRCKSHFKIIWAGILLYFLAKSKMSGFSRGTGSPDLDHPLSGAPRGAYP
jgi:hypothetical protein